MRKPSVKQPSWSVVTWERSTFRRFHSMKDTSSPSTPAKNSGADLLIFNLPPVQHLNHPLNPPEQLFCLCGLWCDLSEFDIQIMQGKQEKEAKQGAKKSDSALLDIIKRMNGFKDNVWKEMDKIESIELVLEDFGNMQVINRFKGLRSLTLINCGVAAIDGLTDLNRLEALWLNENEIAKIEGLDKCYALKSLYLSHNHIRSIQGLSGLVNLETLWLCDNKIEAIENLDGLSSLKQLWIAGNQIDSIKTSLDSLVNLTDLNIAGNKICSFKEVLNLNRLANLKVLSFYDPHFGENPICNLCNYQTYVLYHLRNICKLDTLTISEEAKAYAESTLMRKKMYYNMRIKTIERTFSTLTKLIEKAQNIKLDGINEDLANLCIKINDIGMDPTKIAELKEIHELKKEQINHIECVYESVSKRLRDVNKVSIRKLLAEFETGGNIRLEEGKASEKWFVSCVDLIKSRFHPEDLMKDVISGINIKRVIRIHNRFLKNKFEEKMEVLADITNINSRKQLEYLFYGVDPNIPSELDHVIQQGFRTPEEAKKLGICPFVPLFNSILCADLPRITHYLDHQRANNKLGKNFIKKRNLGDLCLLPTGSILICKVLMVKEEIDANCPYFAPKVPPSELFRTGKVDFPEGHYAVRRSLESEGREKMWFVMDNNLVIPEYLVEYDYVLDNPNQNKVADFGDTVGLLETKDDEFISAKNIATYQKDLNNIYNALVQEISAYQFESIDEKNSVNLEIQANELDRFDLGTLKVGLVNYFKYCLSRSNLFYDLNENLLFEGKDDFDIKRLNIQDPSILQFANLSNLKIKNLHFIAPFKNIEVLVLSYNQLSSLSDLEDLSTVKKLDVSHNRIASLAGLSSLPLQQLDLSHNALTNHQSLAILQLCKGTLREVNVLFNPFQDQRRAVLFLGARLGNLLWLNHMPKGKFVQFQSQENSTNTIGDDMLRENCKIMQSKTLDSADWKLSIESVSLTHMKLSSMAGLEHLHNLRHVNLSNNEINDISGIDHCKLLEELNLQKNNISRIQRLEGLVYLKKMELGKNKITRIEGIATLNNLLQLSLEDNGVESLTEFPELRSLMELYIGNNKISDSNQIKSLSCLNKLIILDLSGNPISKEESYRFYTLFLLKKLKVLDGISIESPEHQQAREHFTGRLTEEVLKENLRGASCEEIMELQLKECNLKDFEDMFSMRKFPKLAELDLTGNQFSSVKMLGNLPTLKILILQANKIETLHFNSDLAALKGLNGCQNLEILDLSNNQLKDFYGLNFCRLGELKILKASRNEIIKIDCLENLKQLKELDINHNKVRQFDPNSFQGKLPIKCLKIDDNGLKNFMHIQKLLRLQHLFANSNKITEFYDIEKLSELPYLKELELTGNILYRKPGYRITTIKKLPGLLYLDGREITPEERAEPASLMQPQQPAANMPQMYVPQLNNQRQVPVRLSSVNFEGVFTSSRLNMENLISQNLYGNSQQPPPPPQQPPRPQLNIPNSKSTPQQNNNRK